MWWVLPSVPVKSLGKQKEKGEILIEKPVDLALEEYAEHKFQIIETPEPNDDDPEM